MPPSTDWESYYRRPFIAAKLSRRLTRRCLLNLLKRFGPTAQRPIVLAELGGGDSCFLDDLFSALTIDCYHVVDTNAAGLDRVRTGARGRPVLLHQADVRNELAPLAGKMDVVFSVGLIEHFDSPGTTRALDAHFELLRPGGLALISYPTPTAPYRLVRRLAELLRIWRFPDERPLRGEEVLPIIRLHAEVLCRKILWPLLLTQEMIAARKR